MGEKRACSDHQFLFTSVSILIQGSTKASDAMKIISASFDSAITGLGGRGGIFLLEYGPISLRLKTLCSSGMPEWEIEAVECGKDIQVMPAAQIWKTVCNVIRANTPGPNDDPDLEVNGVSPNLHVLSRPIYDPILEIPVAILYLERSIGGDTQFESTANDWIHTYALALGQIIHLGFPPPCAEEQAEPVSIKAPDNAPELIGSSAQIKALRTELHEIHIPASSTPDPDPILILGERGTGKDLVARYIYAYSSRRNRPYVAVNCAEITDELATARFFGHKKGSFTGSLANEPGLFRAADQGVLFLDEIADLSLKAQGTLLRVLENRTVVPLGETREQRVNVQVILGTNRDPEEAAAQGLIRPDLLDRFSTQAIRLAPLRERPWDIPALVHYFIQYHEKRTQKKTQPLRPEVLKMMTGYSWPGNVRELARVCSLLVTYTKPGAAIETALVKRLVPHIAKAECNPKASCMLAGDVPLRDALETFGREMILARLRQHNWNVKSARESLGLPKTTFHRYTRALGIADAIHGDSEDKEFRYVSGISAISEIPVFS